MEPSMDLRVYTTGGSTNLFAGGGSSEGADFCNSGRDSGASFDLLVQTIGGSTNFFEDELGISCVGKGMEGGVGKDCEWDIDVEEG